MAKFTFQLTVEPREVLGKGASRRLRRHEEKVPAIIYGGEEEPQNVCISHKDLVKALENEAVYSHILTLAGLSKQQKVVIKDVQRHPYKPKILHLDFMRVSANKPITMHVPLHFTGQDVAPGVVNEGGSVTHHMVELEIRCLPSQLPEYIEIDLTAASLDTVVHLSQVALPKGVELVSVIHGPEDDLPVVSIHKSKRADLDEETSTEGDNTPAGK